MKPNYNSVDLAEVELSDVDREVSIFANVPSHTGQHSTLHNL